MTHKLAFVGFGGVGQGLAQILSERKEFLAETEGLDFTVVAITDLFKGSIYDPNGLHIEEVLNIVKETGKLEDYHAPGVIKGWDSFKTIRDTNADTIIEVTFTDVKTGQPAIDHCKAAFESGKNVVMTNKGPVALAYQELSEMAKKNNVEWGFEGTVMSGTPALRMPISTLAGNDYKAIRGILNGTTNYILTQMEQGLSFDAALKQAQDLGYAEADPTSDIEGYDARYKVVILANYVMKTPLKVEDVKCEGITNLTLEDIEKAKNEGKRWKLIGSVKKAGDQVIAKVGPEMVPVTDPLAAIEGPINAVSFDCDLAGQITLSGPGAGLIETGFSLLIDLINIERKKKSITV